MNCSKCNKEYSESDCGFPNTQCRECHTPELSDAECSGTKRRLCDDFMCRKCYNASLASRDVHAKWSYTRNSCWPIDIFATTNKKYWFTCACGHDSLAAPGDVTMDGCMYCRETARKLCGCALCIPRSFASHPRAKYWSKRNNMTPGEVALYSNRKFEFTCGECDHDFSVQIKSITDTNTWCPYCAGLKLCADDDCDMCHNASFASHERTKYWSSANEKRPRDVFMRTAKKYKFTCSEFHDFTASPDSVSAGKWCPHCHNKTETLIADALSARAIEFERQARFEWCRNIFCLPFDFRVGMTLVECDGAQHFQDVPLFKRTAAENRQRDVQKMKAALDNGYRIVRLSQVCVWTGKFDWRDELARALDSGEPVQYLSADPSIYDAHRADLENLQNPEK